MRVQLKNIFRLITLITLAISVSACGFQLKGQTNVPNELKVMALSSDSGSDVFDRALRIALIKAGINIITANSPNDSLLTLKVNAITSEDTELARNTSNEVSQLQRRLSSHYSIVQNNGKALHGPRKVSTARTFINQDAEESNKLSYNSEQTELMHIELANQIITDLSYVSP